MKLETILDAMEKAEFERLLGVRDKCVKRNRQSRAFHARILRMDAEKDKRIAELSDG